MKRALIIFTAGLLVAVAAYCSFYFLGLAAEHNFPQNPKTELAWRKEGFHIDHTEIQRISELPAPYQTHCAEMCIRSAAKNAELQDLLATNDTVTPEIKAKLSEAA